MFIDTSLAELKAIMRSARRPPQPVLSDDCGTEVCHSRRWSLWEKSESGIRTELFLNCATVVGSTSVPTLAMKAALPVLKRFWSCGIAWWTPKVRPGVLVELSGSRAVGLPLPGAGSARFERIAR